MDERVLPNDPPREADYPGSPDLPHPPAGSEIALLPGVTTFLQQTEPYERVAKEFRASWESVQHDDKHDAIAKAFYEAGDFVAWFAYFRIKRAAEQSGSCIGKTDCRRLIDILQQADVFFQRQLATKVVAVFSDEQKEKIEKLHEKMSPSAARQPTADSNHLQISEAPQPYTTPSLDADRMIIERSTIPTPNSFLTNYEQVIVNPPLTTAKKLLHKDLSNAIGTTQNPIPKGALLAAISMAFPPTGGRDDCQMVLEILEDKVQHFAKRWFKKRLESKDGLRCLVARDGSTIVPYPQFTLRGFRRRRRTDFGRVVSHAITTSPRYQDDEKHSRPYTDGVSMVVSAQANARAHVYLSLGLVEGIRIKDKLFV